MKKNVSIGIIFCMLLTYLPGMVQGDDTFDSIAFVVITPAQFADELAAFQNHKEQHGITARVVTLDDIYTSVYFPVQGRDEPERIKYFIKNAKETWDATSVLLVGGKNLMPVRYTRTCFYGDNSTVLYQDYISDLYYADLYFANHSFCSWDSNNDSLFADKNLTGYIDLVDLYPDVYVGRWLTNTADEVTTVVDKVITYENTAFGQSWFKNLVVCGGDDARSLLIEAAFPLFLHKFGVPVFEGEYLGNKAARILSDFSVAKIYGTGFVRPGIKALTVGNIQEAIDDGAGFLMFNGHGAAEYAILTNFPLMKTVWLPRPHPFNCSDVELLTNGEKLPIAVFGGCNCGDHMVSDVPIAWKFVAHDGGGAIASFACSCGAVLTLGSLCTDCLHGYMLMQIFSRYADGESCAGALWSDAITGLLDDSDAYALGDAFSMWNWHHVLANHYVLEQWTLFGDPTLRIGGYP